jgi:catechol-2,3-dioxygenase
MRARPWRCSNSSAVELQQEQSMIGYVTLGTNDLARAATFYDALLG